VPFKSLRPGAKLTGCKNLWINEKGSVLVYFSYVVPDYMTLMSMCAIQNLTVFRKTLQTGINPPLLVGNLEVLAVLQYIFIRILCKIFREMRFMCRGDRTLFVFSLF